jgi:hypothetical protein
LKDHAKLASHLKVLFSMFYFFQNFAQFLGFFFIAAVETQREQGEISF